MHNVLEVTLTLCLLTLSPTVWAQAAADTIFIQKDPHYGVAQSIFHLRHHKKKFYDILTQFSLTRFDTASYNYSLRYLGQENKTLPRRSPDIPWRGWINLKQYKGCFYAYYPCDFNSFHAFSMNDSTLIDWTGEGPIAYKVISQKRRDISTYEFSITGIYNKNGTLIVHIIDRKKGIAVIEEIHDGTTRDYYLMIAADCISRVPFIVNNCEHNKQVELQFDKPDFNSLLTK